MLCCAVLPGPGRVSALIDFVGFTRETRSAEGDLPMDECVRWLKFRGQILEVVLQMVT